MTEYFYEHVDTELGLMEIKASDLGVKSIHFVTSANEVRTNSVSSATKQQLMEYFAKQRQVFDLPLDADGTDFQKKVWQELIKIPYGQTCTYGDIAKAIDNPKGMRAVGLANGKNPLTIVVPCHRVIGANGKLTGYAHGTERKAKLLGLESNSLF
jgi:methylated-DNA-[protein]-cysteine S-methyltransferase